MVFFIRCFLLLIFAGAAALADSRIECGSLDSKIMHRAVRYCALLPPSYDSDPQKKFAVLYFLHGLGDNEQSLVNTGEWNVIENLREKGKIGDFVIVTPEADRTFYVNSYDGRTPYSDFFIKEFMPAVERKYRIRSEAAARGISGISMGGYGALRFAFAYPHLFSSVSAHSAALLPQPVEKLRSTVNASPALNGLLGNVFGKPINSAHWEQNSPYVLARKNAAALRKLRIYFDCGSSDDYGFDSGARALDKELNKQNIKHEFHLNLGNHSLSYFLGQLPISMEFHSRAFSAN